MAEFFAELKRRQMFRVAAAYAVVAWLILQVVNSLVPGLNLPNWAITLVIVLLGAGFPVALLFCWIQQLAPGDGAQAQVKVNKLDWILAGGLAAVIALLLYQQLAPMGATTAQGKGDADAAAGANGGAGISIAVLPLANLSGDAAQEFFSDGMTDEITSALAKVRDLRVVGRSSAFQFKGQNRDLRAIGQALAAHYLIDGSVRREGDRVRITAQLIQADNGLNVWTESYDRQLTGVFAIQEEIALAIAVALRVPLGLAQGANLVSSRDINPDSYEQFLRAKALVRARGGSGGLKALTDAAKLLEEVVASEPDFGPAWALLALGYFLMPTFQPAYLSGALEQARSLFESSLPKAELAAQRAVELDPRNPDGYIALASVQFWRGKYETAEDLFKRALALDPANPDGLHLHSAMLAESGHVKSAIPMRLRLQTLEPLVPIFQNITARVMLADAQADAALAVLTQSGSGLNTTRARIYAAQGRYREAVDLLLAVPEGDHLPGILEAAAQTLRTAPARAASPQTLLRLGDLGFVYVYVGAFDRVLEFYEDNLKIDNRDVPENIFLWQPAYEPIRKTKRFKDYVRDAGMLDYWRARGWPDLCRPVGADDFECE